MIKSIKEEIEKYLKDNPALEKEINNRKIEKEIIKIIPPKILKGIKEISIVNFDHNDVIRHPLVTKIVEAYQKNINDKG